MTVTLELKPEVEERIAAAAKASGLSLDEFIKLKLEEKYSTPDPNAIPYEEWLQKFNSWIESHKHIQGPPLSDEAISRESIYREREDKQL
jgi:hypothetical protein